MFTMADTDNEETETELDGSSYEIVKEKEYLSGGSSLLRNKELEENVITAATVTIGGDTLAESNVHARTQIFTP